MKATYLNLCWGCFCGLIFWSWSDNLILVKKSQKQTEAAIELYQKWELRYNHLLYSKITLLIDEANHVLRVRSDNDTNEVVFPYVIK